MGSFLSGLASKVGGAAKRVGKAINSAESGSSGDSDGKSGATSRQDKIRKGFSDLSKSGNARAQGAAQAANQSNREVDRDSQDFRGAASQRLGSFKKGGKVKRTGDYLLHKNERVLTARQESKRKRSKSSR